MQATKNTVFEIKKKLYRNSIIEIIFDLNLLFFFLWILVFPLSSYYFLCCSVLLFYPIFLSCLVYFCLSLSHPFLSRNAIYCLSANSLVQCLVCCILFSCSVLFFFVLFFVCPFCLVLSCTVLFCPVTYRYVLTFLVLS